MSDIAAEEIGLYPFRVYSALLSDRFFDLDSVARKSYDEISKLTDDQKYKPLPHPLAADQKLFLVETATRCLAQQNYDERLARGKAGVSGEDAAKGDWYLAEQHLTHRVPLNVPIPVRLVPADLFGKPLCVLQPPKASEPAAPAVN